MGPIELLMILGALVVLYIIVKLLGRLFGRSGREPYYRRGNDANYSAGQRHNFAGIEKKKNMGPWKDPFDNPAQKAAQNAQKIYNDIQKRNANIRKQTDDTIKNMTKRSRGW